MKKKEIIPKHQHRYKTARASQLVEGRPKCLFLYIKKPRKLFPSRCSSRMYYNKNCEKIFRYNSRKMYHIIRMPPANSYYEKFRALEKVRLLQKNWFAGINNIQRIRTIRRNITWTILIRSSSNKRTKRSANFWHAGAKFTQTPAETSLYIS